MAEVTGDLGGQPIQLNNAATEATLKELLAAVLKSGMTGKGGKAQKELEEKIKKLTKEVDELTDAQKDAIKQAKEAEKLKEKEIKQAAELGKAMQDLYGSVTSLLTGMTNLMSTMSRLDNSMTAAASSLSAIPIVGNTLATVFGAVAGAADRTYKAFQQAASVGANFGGSITEMVNAAAGAGLTFDQFSGIVSRTGDSLALLGGSTEQGAKRLAELGKGIKNSQLGNELARMGYSTEQINESMAKYGGMLAKTGALQGMSNSQLIAQTGQYLQNLDAVSKLTGQTKKDLEEQRAQRLKDAQFRYITGRMDAKSQEELNAFLDTLPPELQQGAKEIIATGTATTDAGKAFMTYMSGSSAKLLNINQQIEKTGKFTSDNARELNSAVQNEAKQVAKSPLAGNMMKFGDQYAQGVFVGIANVAAREKDLAKIKDEEQKAAAERLRKEQLGIKEVDPAKLKDFQEKIANISNQFSVLLMNSGLLDTFMKTFGAMVGFIQTFVVPTFNFLAENATLVGIVMAPLVATIAAVNTALAINNFLENARKVANLGAIASLGKLTIAGLAASLPFLKIAAPVLLLIYAFKKMYEAGWSVGDVFEAIGDNMKRLFLTLADGFLWLLDKVTFGDANKKIKQAKQVLELERQELNDKEKARDQRRKDKREERGIKEEENKTTKESTDLKKQENEAKKEGQKAEVSQPSGIDLSTPQKMYESAMRRQQGATAQPGAGAAQPGGAAATTPAPAPPMNQDQAKNMELIKAAMQRQGITDPKYIAATLGNVMKETGGKVVEENLNYGKTSNERIRSIFGSRVAGKSDAEINAIKADPKQMGEMMYGHTTKMGQGMGNTEPGDGWKYRGRGNIGLTGKSNYAAASKAIYGDDRLVQTPELVNDPATAAEVTAWYMKKSQASMAKKMGIDTATMTQDQANLLATSQVAGTAITRGKGFLGGEIMNKVDAYAAQFAGTAAAPTSQAAQTALAQAPAAAPNKPATTATQTAQAPASTQENPATLLASLNTKLDTLIALNRRANDTRDRQLSAAKASAGEVTPWAAA